jgi:L-alanine-DL-glutamate epimerase-like enolase superfamily enzyme
VIGEPEQMAASAKRSMTPGHLKVKLDDRLISERMVAIRSAVPSATLIVDANESWHPEGWPRDASCWPIWAWRCWSSLCRQRMMRR